MIRKIFLLWFFAAGMAVASFSQNPVEFDIKPDEVISKEVVLKGTKKFEELKVMIKMHWKSVDGRLIMTFDRKSVSENDSYLLFIPIFQNRKTLKEVMDCKLEKKSLWSKAIKLDQNYMSYFMKSSNLSISEQFDCYLSLANNNEEEFSFEIRNKEEDYTIELNELYVAKTEKKALYFLSKKNKKLLFKVSPVTLVMRPEKKKVEVVNVCCMEDIALAYIELQQTILKPYTVALMDAQKKQNCNLFITQMEKIKSVYEEVNEKCEEYKTCELVAPALQIFNEECENYMKEECKRVVQQAAVCNMSENELMSTNTALRNLQMKVNVKIKDGIGTADELRDFQAIKSSINPKLTPDCRRKFKNLVDAYTNYCTVLEGLFK